MIKVDLQNKLLSYRHTPFPGVIDSWFEVSVPLPVISSAAQVERSLNPSLAVWPANCGQFSHAGKTYYAKILRHLDKPEAQQALLLNVNSQLQGYGITLEEAHSRGFHPITVVRLAIEYVQDLAVQAGQNRFPIRYIAELDLKHLPAPQPKVG